MSTKRIGFRTAINSAVRLVKSISDQQDDPMNEYAPSECMAVIGDGINRQIKVFQRKTGWSIAELLNEAEGRTSPGWVYRSGLDMLVIQ